jgi:hypothetical protein
VSLPAVLRIALFHQATRRIFRGERDVESRYGHTFGTEVEYTGLRAVPNEPPVHVLLRLNTDDPAVGVISKWPRWLPLLCAIRYGACDLGYRVVSDQRVEILHQGETKPWEGFPYPGYPDRLRPRPISFQTLDYHPDRPNDVLMTIGVFGCDGLTEELFAELTRYVVREGIYDPDISGWETPEQFLREGLCWPLIQGRPDDDCPDRTCANHDRKGSMEVFAIFEEDSQEGVRKLWGPDCGNLQIIHQLCPECGAIRTTNQCT